MSLELELEADRLRRERIVQALALVASSGGAGVMFWVFGPPEVGDPIVAADGRVMHIELGLWTWLRGNVHGLVLVVLARVALVKLVRTERELRRVRTASRSGPEAGPLGSVTRGADFPCADVVQR